MTYSSIVEMAQSQSLSQRIAACAAQEEIAEPQGWVATNMWRLAASPGWAEKWDYAKGTYAKDKNPDTGDRPDVISDEDILAAVQALTGRTA